MFKQLLLLSGIGLATISHAASHNPQQILNSIRGKSDEGMQIVQLFCANCHASNPKIELGAPKIGQLSDWEPRMKQGLDTLLQHSQEGIGAMPAMGGCFECSDEQLRLAVLAMLPELIIKRIKKTES